MLPFVTSTRDNRITDIFLHIKENDNSTSPYIRNSVLGPLGYRGSAGDAFRFLVEVGIFDEFANMPHLRAQHLGVCHGL